MTNTSPYAVPIKSTDIIHPVIKKFIDSGFKHMKWTDIPGNKVWLTENTASKLVWYEENIVIEEYYLLPNKFTPMHSHPFDNHIIFLGGDMIAWRELPDGSIRKVVMPDSQIGVLSSCCPRGCGHAFETGPRGSSIYNIQIWPHEIEDIASAIVNYYGDSMGPVHESMIRKVADK